MAAPILDRFMAEVGKLHARRVTRRFFKSVGRATAEQESLLLGLIRSAAESDFGREHHFDRIRTYRDYAANVPIRSYDEISPYVERVRRGRVSALLPAGSPVLMFALTSGTTATPKYIPITPAVLAQCRRAWNIWGLRALLQHSECFVRHIVQVTSPMNDHVSPSGVPCGAITGLLAATQKGIVRKYYTSPLAVADIKDSAAKYYTIMRLAIPKDVSWAVTANPATLLALARSADENREKIIRDIFDGTLSEQFSIDGGVRDVLCRGIRPDPTCARRLESIVREHGALYPKHYWRLGFLAHWTGGTMGLYRPQFPKYFGDVPARDIGLIASEGRMSIPLEDASASGVLAVTSSFFEFIPAAEYDGANCTALRSHEVREGDEYFIVLSNASGLYRYDMGDRVRVTGRLGEAPMIEFLSRDDHTSSMAGEKLTEDQVVLAVARAWGDEPVTADFIVAPQWGEVPHYRLYLEEGHRGTPQEWAKRLDRALRAINIEYDVKRETLRLGGVEAVALPRGTLAARDQRLKRERARTAEQFKHQYLLSRPGMDSEFHRRSADAASIAS